MIDNNYNLKEQLDRIENLLERQALHSKMVLSFKEAVAFLGLSEGYVYRLTSTNQIPYYRPNGRRIYFKREELQNWLLRNKQITKEEAEEEALNYFQKSK